MGKEYKLNSEQEKYYKEQINEINAVIDLMRQQRETLGSIDRETDAKIATQLVIDSHNDDRFQEEQGHLGTMYGAYLNGMD